MNAQPLTVVGLGEVLFDCFADHQALGGAPLNFALHAHQLLAASGGRGVAISRVGDDALGRRALAELSARGMQTATIQRDPAHPTGTVQVTVGPAGEPTYTITENVAWDHIELTPEAERLVGGCAAVCFGTLAQRSPRSRETIRALLQRAPQALRLFDVNLRQRYYDADVLDASLRLASALKLNQEELSQVCSLLALGQSGGDDDTRAGALLRAYSLDFVALTRGAAGTRLVLPGRAVDGPPARVAPEANADTVGAGDACGAAIVCATLRRLSPERTVELANRVGAFVAGRRGATPQLPDALRTAFTA